METSHVRRKSRDSFSDRSSAHERDDDEEEDDESEDDYSTYNVTTTSENSMQSYSVDGAHSGPTSSTQFYRKRRKNLRLTGEEMLCVVCRAPSTGYNFNVISCESCKAFFRRNALKNTPRLTRCKRGGNCIVVEPERKKCPACRLMRCLEMGMKRELITPEHKLVMRANYRGKRQQRKLAMKRNREACEAQTAVNRSQCEKSGRETPVATEERRMSVSTEVVYEGRRSLQRLTNRSTNIDALGEQGSKISVRYSTPMSGETQPSQVPLETPQPEVSVQNKRPTATFTSSAHSSTSSMAPLSPGNDVKASIPAVARPRSSMFSSEGKSTSSSTAPPLLVTSCVPKKRHLLSSAMDCVKEAAPSSCGTTSGDGDAMPLNTPSVISTLPSPSECNPATTGALSLSSPFYQPLPTKWRPVLAATDIFTEELFHTLKQNLQQALAILTEPMREMEMIRCNLNTLPSSIESSFNRIEASIRRLIYTFKAMPQFTLLAKSTQMTMLKQSMYGLLVFCGVLVYEPESKSLRVTYYTNNGERRSHLLDFETYLRRGFGNIQSFMPVSNKDSAFTPLVSKSSTSSSSSSTKLPNASSSSSLVGGEFAGVNLESLREQAFNGTLPPSAMAHLPDFAKSMLMQMGGGGGGGVGGAHSLENSGSSSSGQTSFLAGAGDLGAGMMQEKINMVVGLNHRIFEQVLQITDKDNTLILALCMLRLFRGEVDSQMSRNCQYLIQRTRSELTWFITHYATQMWTDAHGTGDGLLLTETVLQERLQQVFSIFHIIQPLERVGTLFDQFVNPNFVSPLMQDFLSPPERGVGTSTSTTSSSSSSSFMGAASRNTGYHHVHQNGTSAM